MCNEPNNPRRAKLKKVLKDYLPPQALQRVTITGIDGEKWSQIESRKFDRILVDAPCSSERHLIHNNKEMTDWSKTHTKKNAERQVIIQQTQNTNTNTNTSTNTNTNKTITNH